MLAATGRVPTLSKLEQILKEFPADKVDDKNTFSWDKTVKRGIAEVEEHNIKLVAQVGDQRTLALVEHEAARRGARGGHWLLPGEKRLS